MQIVAIGGGELKDRETLQIDKFIIELTGKHSPKALFIPTASGDDAKYCSTFDRIYGALLGCRTDHLRLLSCVKDRKQAEDKILRAHLVYVGGGNTLRMMRLWRKLGIDRILKTAGKQGTVLAGLSAGAICWYEWGHSDSRSFAGKNNWSFIRVRGLGICRGMFCPHLDVEHRRKPFSQMIEHYGILGIGCDNNAAIWYNSGEMVAKTSRSQATVSVFQRVNGKVRIEKYRNGETVEIANNSMQRTRTSSAADA